MMLIILCFNCIDIVIHIYVVDQANAASIELMLLKLQMCWTRRTLSMDSPCITASMLLVLRVNVCENTV